MLSDDGTDYRIAMNYAKDIHPHKFKKSALRYEVGVGIKSGDICWWWGPFEPGIWNDNMIFQSALVHELEEGERVETDAGYKASAPERVKCPGTVMSDLDNRNVRWTPVPGMKRSKQWKILSNPYRHDIVDHQKLFAAIASSYSLNFALRMGSRLFSSRVRWLNKTSLFICSNDMLFCHTIIYQMSFQYICSRVQYGIIKGQHGTICTHDT